MKKFKKRFRKSVKTVRRAKYTEIKRLYTLDMHCVLEGNRIMQAARHDGFRGGGTISKVRRGFPLRS